MALAIVVSAAATMWAAGTTMTLTFGTPTVECTTNGGSVSATYTIATTAADAANVTETLTLDGTEVKSNSFTIPSGGGWTIAGRTKTFDGTFTADGLADGTYTLEVCVAQSGSNGNPGKSVCQSETIEIACAPTADPPCATEPFGEVVGNHHIGVNAAAQINFRGDFGDEATLMITGNGYSASTTVNRDGNSCNYHANWKFTTTSGADIYGNAGSGPYNIVVIGNGHTLTFSTTLVD